MRHIVSLLNESAFDHLHPQAPHPKSVMAPKLAALQGSGVFAFSREQLSTLHNTKNSTAFLQVGGLEGLVKGLRSDRTKGIGRPVEEAAADSTSLRMLSSSSVWHDRGVLRYVALSTRKNVTAGESPPSTTAGLFAERRAVFGNNQLPTKKQPSFIHMVWRAYNDPVLFFLTGAAAISLAIGLYQTFTSTHSVNNPPLEWVDGVTILVAVIIIVLVGSINDWVKSQRFQKLNEKQLEQDSSVIRFGVSRRIPNSEIYVGDVVHLEAGDVIPADGILVSGHKVMCDESSVTGALELVLKTPGDEAFRAMSEQNETSLDPFILSGTKVLEGVGTFLVASTGVHSIYGKILESLRDQPDPVPLLQARLTVVAKQLAWMGGIISLVLFVALFIKFLAGLHRDSSSPAGKAKNFVDIAIIALSVLVIAAPEGLPLALALSLAQAATRMLKENVLVRQLKACETMGNATNLCTDKTGMLTQNKMAVVAGTVGLNFRFYDKRGVSVSSLGPESSTEDSAHGLAEDVRKLLRESIVLNTAPFEVDHEFSIVGSNTESTLLKFAEDHLGMCLLEEERQKENMVQFIPLDSAHKCIATVIELPSPVCKYRVFIKGAPEILLSKSTRIIPDPSTASSDIELNSTGREQVARTIDSYANQALRTIGLAYRDLPLPSQKDGTRKSKTDFTIDYLLNDLVFLAVMAIHDPLRPGVSQTVQTCQRANVIVRMVTGDNILTATAIAKQCGIYSDNSEDIAMEGTQFWALPDDELALKLPHLKVLARASPEDKQKLVVRLKGVGEVVAYAGDGTNDALAMSAADVSFAMGGVTGTEVARQASSIILLTDDFTCIIKAIMWGRAVKDSVKKYLLFQIIVTVSSALLAFVSAILDSDEQSVLTPVQLMWINLFQDAFGALALATDPPHRRVLDRKPEPRTARLIDLPMWKTIIGQSIYQLAVTYVLYFLGPQIFPYNTNTEILQVNTLVFNAYVWMQIFNMFNCRQYDNTLNVFEGMFNNKLFIMVIISMTVLQTIIVIVGGVAFSVTRLTAAQWVVSIVLGALTLPVGALIRCIPEWPIQWMIDSVRRRRRTELASSSYDSTNVISPI